MFTSANAARMGGAQLDRYTHLPAFAVGGATAQAVAKAGFASVTSGEEGVQSLLNLIAKRGHNNVLHISGRDIRTFEPKGLRVASACAYAAVEIGNTEDLLALLTPGMILLVHSPRAGERLKDLVPIADRSDLHIVAISDATLAMCSTGWASALAAESPRDDAMLALAAGLCK